MISPWTIIAALYRFGPMSPEALAAYLARESPATATEAFDVLSEMVKIGRVVVSEEPLRFGLPAWRPYRCNPWERLFTVRQADRSQEFRRHHDDSRVAQIKVAAQIGCTLEDLRAFIGRNPRPA
jgi:hypothetical protein